MKLERVAGIEPALSAWKAGVIPLYDTRSGGTLACWLALSISQRVGSGSMSSLLLRGGRVIDPANDFDQVADLLVSNGKIAGVGAALEVPTDAETIDCTGQIVCPGLIDLHVHLREPGQSAKETIATGTAAAAAGGFTSVVCMPNTSPVIDSPSTVALIQGKAEREAVVNVFVTGAITKDIAGKELAPIGSLKQAGVLAITDDGHCIQNHDLMRRALEYAKMFDLPVMDHCQDYSLVTDGVMHEGYWSAALGLKGWPASGEDLIVARNIQLAQLTGTHVHCQHVSSADSVKLIREAKAQGIPISGEACAHHFVLTDAAIAGSEKFWAKDGAGLQPEGARPEWPVYDTHFKMNPPLRSAKDREAILEGLCDGTLEILASDHAPHCAHEKDVEFDYSPFGITGLETELSLSLMQLHHSNMLGLPELLAKYTVNPARLLKIKKGTLESGSDADVTVIDADEEWTYDATSDASQSANSPFNGWRLRGRAVLTVVAGEIVWRAEAIAA